MCCYGCDCVFGLQLQSSCDNFQGPLIIQMICRKSTLTEISQILVILLSRHVLQKFCTDHVSDTAVLCAKFHKDLCTYMDKPDLGLDRFLMDYVYCYDPQISNTHSNAIFLHVSLLCATWWSSDFLTGHVALVAFIVTAKQVPYHLVNVLQFSQR